MKRKSRLEMKEIWASRRRNPAGRGGTTEKTFAGTRVFFHAMKDEKCALHVFSNEDEGSHRRGGHHRKRRAYDRGESDRRSPVFLVVHGENIQLLSMCVRKNELLFNVCESPRGPPASPRRRRRNICASFFPSVKTFQGGQTVPG